MTRTTHRADLWLRSQSSNAAAVPSNWRLAADGLTGVMWSPPGLTSLAHSSNSATGSLSLVGGAGITITSSLEGAFTIAAAGGATAVITLVADGNGSTLTTGVKGDRRIPFACVIEDWSIVADQSGSVVLDVWKDTLGNYPPTVADSITASAKPTLSGAARAQSGTLTGWTTTIAANETLRLNIDSVATVTRVTLDLKVRKL